MNDMRRQSLGSRLTDDDGVEIELDIRLGSDSDSSKDSINTQCSRTTIGAFLCAYCCSFVLLSILHM